MKTVYITVSNSYNAKEDLKKAGFTFSASAKQWVGTEESYNDFKDRFCSITYCGSRASKNKAVTFEKKDIIN